MTHLYTRGSEYGLLSLQVMLGEPSRLWKVPDICRTARTPEQFTRKVLQSLVKAGILESTRGPGGGFSFARDPADITLFEVVQAVEVKARFDLCILGLAECSEQEPCALHHLWAPIKKSALDMLRGRSVCDLAGVPMTQKKRRGTTARSSGSRRRPKPNS